VLEIGCGDGGRLAWLAENINAELFGIEPSKLAVEQACKRGVKAQHGTADNLPYENETFDILVFGFCLCWCDRGDLFSIAREANRVLMPNAWLIIGDFFATSPIRRENHHKPGVYTHKMDCRTLFDWHPAYTCYQHRVSHHVESGFTDDPQEWIAVSIMRKKTISDG
jgi:ubiquinone/menaquinone biosynthesis C-methylase UbiE